MQAAFETGTPWGVFQGTRDPGGPWTDEDRLYATAWIAYRNGVHKCGHHTSETTDPRMFERYVPDDFDICQACVALEIAYEQVSDEKKKWPLLHKRDGAYMYRIQALPPLSPDHPIVRAVTRR